MKIRIYPSRAYGEISAPPSKSMAHRLLICAALSSGVSKIHGVSDCDDVRATLSCLSALGIRTETEGDSIAVYGKSYKELSPACELFANESGSTLRFILPICALLGQDVTVCGKEGLMKRPMEIYEKIFGEHSAGYKKHGNKITVSGKLESGIYTLPGDVSSQFVSGLLFALSALDSDSVIEITPPIESRSYIDMTLSALHTFGIDAEWTDAFHIKIDGQSGYTPSDAIVEGDFSGAAFTDALNELGGNVTVKGLSEDSLQGDAVYKELYRLLDTDMPTLKIGNCPDLAPILFTLAAYKNGAVFEETRRLAVKESSRAAVMAEELSKFGASIEVYENSVIVRKSELHAPNEPLCGHNDHRIVMSLAVLLTAYGGEIDGAEAIKKSYPSFFDDIRRLGIKAEEIQ